MAKKTVFIAHPISGDVKGNIEKVLKICAQVHSKNVIPVAPYLVSLHYLDDNVEEDRGLGIEANHECFRRRYVDELWLFGNRISNGMRQEILLAWQIDIPILAKTEETRRDLEAMEHVLTSTR